MGRVSRGKVEHLKELYGCIHPALWSYVSMYRSEGERLERQTGFNPCPINMRASESSRPKQPTLREMFFTPPEVYSDEPQQG